VWILTHIGIDRVVFVDGGIAAWQARGFEISSAPSDRRGPRGAICCSTREEVRATTEEVEAVVASGVGILGDTRSWAEFIGKRHDYPYFDTLGRIHGAVWARWGESTYVGGDFWMTGEEGVMRDLDELKFMWEKCGVQPADGAPLIFYCGTGWRSSYAWLIARLLGWEAKNYDGGWLQWSTLHPNSAQHRAERGSVVACALRRTLPATSV